MKTDVGNLSPSFPSTPRSRRALCFLLPLREPHPLMFPPPPPSSPRVSSPAVGIVRGEGRITETAAAVAPTTPHPRTVAIDRTPCRGPSSFNRVDPYAYPQPIKVLKHLHTYDMDVGCSLRGFGGLNNSQNSKNTHQKPILASKIPTSRGILA